jgi:hypothetical protein
LVIAISANAQSNITDVKNDMTGSGEPANTSKTEKREERREIRKMNENAVGYQAQQQFYRYFGDAPITKWEKIGSLDKATFTKDGQTTAAFFDYDAQLIGTITSKTLSDLPAKAQEHIKNKYKDYEVKNVLFFDDNEYNQTDMELYGQQFDDEDNYFVELTKGKNDIVLQANLEGEVFFFRQVQ